MKCCHRSEVSGGQRAATLQFNNFVKKIIMQQLLLNLETVTVCNHWNLLEYNYTCTSADAWNAYLLIAAWTAFPATTIWAGYNFDRASYLHVSSRASIYKPLGLLRPRSDKTPGRIFSWTWTSTQVLYTLHVKSSSLQKKFKVQTSKFMIS